MWSHSAPQLIIKLNSIPLTVTMETTQVVFNNYFLQRSAHTGTHGLCPWTWEVFFFSRTNGWQKLTFSPWQHPWCLQTKYKKKEKELTTGVECYECTSRDRMWLSQHTALWPRATAEVNMLVVGDIGLEYRSLYTGHSCSRIKHTH